MKGIITLVLLILFTASIYSQLRLNIAGDAKITGRMDISSGTNMFVGKDAGLLSTGNFNTFLGLYTGAANTTGESNTFIGLFSGFSNTTGLENTFIGAGAGLSNIDGNFNTFMGKDAGRSNTEGSDNTFVGLEAGLNNTTGSANILIGRKAGQSNITGKDNTFVGGQSTGRENTTGSANVFIGPFAGRVNATGGNNTFVGVSSGFFSETGSDNTFVGFGAGVGINAIALTNSMALGYQSNVTASNTIAIGNTDITSIKGQVSFTTFSDGRYKQSIQEDIPGLDFVLHLRPVTYQVDAHGIAAFLGEDDLQQKLKEEDLTLTFSKDPESEQKGRNAKSQIRYSGFIAQEVEKAAEKVGYAFSGVDKPQNEQSLYGLRYAEFVVPLVKAVQEQQEIVETQQRSIKDLQNEVTELKSLVEQLLAKKQEISPGDQAELYLVPKPILGQNHPNPFHQNTVVEYFIPDQVQQAQLQIHATDGKLLATLPISGNGAGKVNIKAHSYPAGTYTYSLILDGRVVETKRMVLTK